MKKLILLTCILSLGIAPVRATAAATPNSAFSTAKNIGSRTVSDITKASRE